MKTSRLLLATILAGTLMTCSYAREPEAITKTPLDDYIAAADPSYSWKVAKTIEGNPAETSIIKLTSQSWRAPGEVSRTAWEHWLVVVKPEKLTTDRVFLMVGGGGNDRPMPESASGMITQIAEATGSIVAELRMVPNQPLVFHDDGEGRVEDDLIGYCWAEFLETGDANWLPRLPMVKSVVKAMDCLQEWSREQGTPVEKFVVAGGSKRGWTTWMTGIVDPRCEAIVPIVIDVLNVDKSIRHHGAVYGFWAKALGNYVQHHILERFDHPRMADLYAVADPFSYRDRLELPKYVVNGSGDQFFCPDSSQFYYDELPGEKHLRYVPNADHSLERAEDAVPSIVAFYQMVVSGRARPKTSWTFEPDGSIRVVSDLEPEQVLLWQASNTEARDFRLMTIGPAWESTELKKQSDGSWRGRPAKPEKGWNAALVELAYDSGGPFPFKVSTAVRITPDVLPYKDVDPTTLPYEGLLDEERDQAGKSAAVGGR
jgi:PhoPQ-activated pathogenicity-related protein